MLNYWSILLILTGIQLVLATILFYMVIRLGKGPIGLRLAAIALVFTFQSIFALMVYDNWMLSGYGPDISIPLIALQSGTVIGTGILLDIVRK